MKPINYHGRSGDGEWDSSDDDRDYRKGGTTHYGSGNNNSSSNGDSNSGGNYGGESNGNKKPEAKPRELNELLHRALLKAAEPGEGDEEPEKLEATGGSEVYGRDVDAEESAEEKEYRRQQEEYQVRYDQHAIFDDPTIT